MPQLIAIQSIKETSGVEFGTSGARGLASEMTDKVCYLYAAAFIQMLRKRGELSAVALGGDRRPSSGSIMAACARAAADCGVTVRNCGEIASPALALFGLENAIPTMMITGSHIPDDRNGIKFTTPQGEITKKEECEILAQNVEVPEGLFSDDGTFHRRNELPPASKEATDHYINRYVEYFGEDALSNLKVGVYQHSAVARDTLVELYQSVGADVTALGRSERFIPVDTEAIRPEDKELALQWSQEHRFDTIVSADGDSDRPLIADEHGNWLRGDILGILAAKAMCATTVVAPVSCNTALEKCGFFKRVVRTKVGSPYVISAMEQFSNDPSEIVVGFEANGGFLLGSTLFRDKAVLRALPTRDAVLPQLAVLTFARDSEQSLSELVSSLPQRFTESDRLKDFSPSRAQKVINRLASKNVKTDLQNFAEYFANNKLQASVVSYEDGVRFICNNDEVVHIRPSGNAPELRCYAEAASVNRAQELVTSVLATIAQNSNT